MLTLLITNFLGAITFLFIFWRRLKEDYSSGIIFSVGFSVIIVIAILVFSAKFFAPVWWFWIIILGISATIFISITKFKLKFFETIDSSFASLLPWVALIFLYHSVVQRNSYSLGAFVVVSLVYLLYIFFNANYKKFSWYVSGKVGFSGLMSMGILFLARGLASLLFPDVLSFVGNLESAISGIVSIISFLGVFYLAKKIE